MLEFSIVKKTVANLLSLLKQKSLGALIVTNPVNIFYVCGFKGISPKEREAILVITPKKMTLVTARLYQAEAKHAKATFEGDSLDVKIAAERNEINEFIREAVFPSIPFKPGLKQVDKPGLNVSVPTIGFEANHLTFAEFRAFRKLLKGSKLTPTKHLIEDLRMVKRDREIEYIEKAQIISQNAFWQIIKTIKAGQMETEIAERLEKIVKSLGGQGLAFETIVATGPNSALPHYRTGKRQIANGDILLFDFGAKYRNWCADLSRTVFIGKASDQQKNVYDHVAKAQNLAIKKIRAGAKASTFYNQTVGYFKKHSLDGKFLHSLGHGIGLEVHEKPSLSKKSKDKLAQNMVFSVEPGLYFPRWGGIRIEDLVTVDSSGRARILGQYARFIEIA